MSNLRPNLRGVMLDGKYSLRARRLYRLYILKQASQNICFDFVFVLVLFRMDPHLLTTSIIFTD